MSNLKSRVEALVLENDLRGAVEEFYNVENISFSIKTNLTLLNARVHKLEQVFDKGSMPQENYDEMSLSIKRSILHLVDYLEQKN